MNKKQLVEEIASKVDDTDYRLILDLDGKFKLIPLNDWNDRIEYVTRWETYDVGNGYVGIEASEDTEFINGIYSWAVEAWDRYKNGGETRVLNSDS